MASCHVPWFYGFVTPYEAPLCCMMERTAQREAYLQYNPYYGPWEYLEEQRVEWWNQPGFVKARAGIAQSTDGCGHRRCTLQLSTEKELRNFYGFPGGSAAFQENLEAAIASMLAGETVVNHFPLHWAVTTGYACPNTCRHCYQVGVRADDNAIIPLERAAALASMAPIARYWELTGGEPLAMPNEVLDLLIPDYPQLYVSMFSSLNVPLTKIERYGGLVSMVNVSVDGCTRETYEYIKRGANFDHLVEATGMLGEQGVVLTGNYVLMGSNVEELDRVPDFFKSLGFVEATVTRMIPSGNREAYSENIYQHDPEMDELIERKLRLAQARAQEVGIHLKDQGINSYLLEAQGT